MYCLSIHVNPILKNICVHWNLIEYFMAKNPILLAH